jgi:hypothetical protein
MSMSLDAGTPTPLEGRPCAPHRSPSVEGGKYQRFTPDAPLARSSAQVQTFGRGFQTAESARDQPVVWCYIGFSRWSRLNFSVCRRT